jgi:hypothetical protein
VAYAAIGLLCAAAALSDGQQTVLGPMRRDVADPAERFNRHFGELTGRALTLDGRELAPAPAARTFVAKGGDAE